MELFMAKVLIIPFVECWLWIGATRGRPERMYGAFFVSEKKIAPAHRWLYEATNEPIAGGLELDHLCRVTLCVRPSHLEPVTPTVNVRRGFSPGAIARRLRLESGLCARGHSTQEHWSETVGVCRKCRSELRLHGVESQRRRWSRADLASLVAGDSDHDLSIRLKRSINAIQTMRSLYSHGIRRTT
jgi:hypothetical protein